MLTGALPFSAPAPLEWVHYHIARQPTPPGERAKHVRPFAQLVHEKTAGNPFFAIQFFTALAEEGLLEFEPRAAAWILDFAGVREKGYTDNVVDLMVGRLKRLSNTTQDALKRLACLGNVVEIATLSLVFGESEVKIHTSLLEAARTGLILRLEGSYAFLHDRIQEAAYALIPEGERAAAHLRIGRVLLASMTADGLAESRRSMLRARHWRGEW
jgi:predicted ATPase